MKNFTLLLAFCFTTFVSLAQTSLSVGDIAFIGVSTDGATDADDSFAFVLLKDIEANTAITFTDRGWNDGTGFVEPLAIGDGEFTWISLSAHNAGHVVILNFANLSPGSAAFTVLGDQLFAIQGTISSPIFIAGMQLNNANGSDNTNWDGAATSNTTSALPDVLTTGDTAIRFPIEQDNWQFTCATGLCPLIGTADEIRAILHNPANWISDNNNVFPGTIDIGFGTPTIGPIDNIPPVINCPADIVFDSFDNQQCGGIVNWDTPIVTDNLPGVTVTSNFNSGDLFPFDTTEVNYTATDAAGNQASCSFMVTVNDKVAPTLTCINGLSIPLSATTGTYTISPLDFIASPITDACGELIYTISRATLDSNMDVRVPSLNINCDDEETILIRIWVEDVNGNSDYCETYVLVDKSLFMCPVDPEPCQVMITSQPDNAVIYEGDPLSYNVTATGTGTLSYQWQVNTGNGFEDLGVPSANSQLSFAFMEFGGDGNQYQVIVTSDNATPNDNTDDCFVISEIASLTVNPLTRITVLKDVFGTGSNPDLQFKFFYNTSIPNELGEFYLSESGVNSPNTEGGEFSFKGGFLFLVSEVDLPEGYSINDIQFISKNSTSNLVSKNTNEIQILIGQSDNVTITFVNQFLNQEPCEIFIQGQPRNAEICAGDPLSFNVGAISTGNLIYQWQVNSGTGFENLGLPSGNSQLNFAFMEIDDNGNQYKVVITSDNDTPNDIDDDCSETSETVTLQVNPKPVVYITGKNSYCYNGNGVQLDAGAGYTSYLWSPGGETTQSISAIEGSYTVKVTNEFGCNTISDPFIVTNNQPLVCNILQDVLSTDHLSTDGVATVYAEGGTGQYTYLWDNGEKTQTATTLTYGLHSVKVTDSNGCETSCQIDIAKQLYCWTNLVQNVSVLGGNDGAASIKGNGGYRPYSFKWDDGSTNEVNSELTPGTHYVVITDASGATSQCSVTIAEPTGGNCDTFMVNVQQDRLSTNHLTADGVATVHPKGGTAPYSYFWDNGETSQTASTLTYGIHTVIVSDYNECKVSIQIDIAKELYCWVNLYNNVSVHGENDGQALVRGNGGFRPYTFLWDDGSTEEVNSNLSAGTHYVTITDASGATSQCSILISEPNQEVCDGIDNDGDGKIDEGFDQDGDGIADCYDICDKGDDHVDIDNDGIPDACDDNICIKSKTPWLECYQTAEWSEQTCSWEVIGEQPMEPVTECYETAVWNGQTCSWDIVDGQPEMPITECYQTAEWSEQTCSWEVIGEQPMEPVTECYETAIWNGQTCSWDIVDGQPEIPITECYQTAEWSEQTCSWEVIGEQPMEPVTECYETAVWNGQTCSWDIVDGQPEMPITECYQTAEWSEQTCSWEVIGEQPMEPVTECYETAIWNGQTCSWDIVDGQPEIPITECYQTAEWSEQTCSWEVIGEQPMEPVTECYETAVWNGQTCDWDITGEQPQEPETECNETAVWSEQICDWEIVENNNDCGSGTIDQCETAFARSADENVRTCFLDIPNISANRWGWTNMIPSVNGNYELDLYAAAGQCDITKGALVGNVNVVYVNGLVDVTVTVLSGYKMTETQLYVGSTLLPLRNNGSQTVAPGQYPYQDDINGDFNTYTFTNISVEDLDSFYIILHANVCPNNGSGLKTMSSPLELMAYPIPFKEELNLKLMSPGNINGKLYLYDGIGREIIDFGMHSFKKGKNEINLNLGELPIGIYFIHLKSDYGNEILKVLGK